MRVVFAGTPDFATPSLEALAASRHRVALVVTQPDRPAGRNRRPTPPEVKLAAERLGLRLLQTDDVNSPASRRAIADVTPDTLVVVSFGQRLRHRILSLPPMGCVNLHASLLPELRGAAPVPWAILRGFQTTGVTTQRMAEEIDAGDILLQDSTPISDDETAGDLAARLARIGAGLLVRTLDDLEAGRIAPAPQDASRATRAPKLSKADGDIPWRRASEEVRRFVRGMTPWPSAFTFLSRDGALRERLTIHSVQVADATAPPRGPAGAVLIADSRDLVVATGSGAVRVLRLQRPGGRPMDAASFLRGYPLRAGDLLHGAQ